MDHFIEATKNVSLILVLIKNSPINAAYLLFCVKTMSRACKIYIPPPLRLTFTASRSYLTIMRQLDELS